MIANVRRRADLALELGLDGRIGLRLKVGWTVGDGHASSIAPSCGRVPKSEQSADTDRDHESGDCTRARRASGQLTWHRLARYLGDASGDRDRVAARGRLRTGAGRAGRHRCGRSSAAPSGRGGRPTIGTPAHRTWSATNNVAWNVDACRAAAGRRRSCGATSVIVTSAVSAGAFKQPSTGIYGNDYVAELQKQGLSDDAGHREAAPARDIESTAEAGELQFMVYSFDVETGEAAVAAAGAHRGRRSAAAIARTPTPRRRRPPTASASTRSSATSGCSATRWTGTLLWTHKIEPQPRYLDFGTAASPVVHDGRVYCSRTTTRRRLVLAALDAKTGDGDLEDDADRRRRGVRSSGWSSPYVWVNAKRTEIVTIGRQLAISYDLEGKELWRLKGFTQANPTPTDGDGMLYRRHRLAGRGEPSAVRGAGRARAATSR